MGMRNMGQEASLVGPVTAARYSPRDYDELMGKLPQYMFVSVKHLGGADPIPLCGMCAPAGCGWGNPCD
jgi:hypothetical protein